MLFLFVKFKRFCEKVSPSPIGFQSSFASWTVSDLPTFVMGLMKSGEMIRH